MPQTDVTPTSASIASTGKGIRYIGEHCYGFSGLTTSSTTEQTLLDYTTGSGYILGVFLLTGGAKLTTAVGLGNMSVWRITLNGEIVALVKTETSTEDMPSIENVEILLPPQTRVAVGLISDQNDANIFNSTTFTGRVYGAD
tara:strand:- start:10 stop:435 length:426 start_codon:yes stop_codon:yes gene_type:complete